ncbi:zf-HC2 domain-containing protein [Microbacterium sp. NRRL B-14842]|uniref:zf-HC2 domain-containing protein n=1 Tax=Microbacterium sp. NRRL B-14842 TaxID=3162881 RepID=UPI003D2DAA52
MEHLGAYSRGNLATRDHRRLELHLDECAPLHDRRGRGEGCVQAPRTRPAPRSSSAPPVPPGTSPPCRAVRPVLAVAGMSSHHPGRGVRR